MVDCQKNSIVAARTLWRRETNHERVMLKAALGDINALASSGQQQALLNFAVSQSTAIFYIAALSGEQPIRFISANVERITGHKASAFIQEARFGRHHIHPDDIAGYDESIKALLNHGSICHDYRFALASGEYRWFRDELRVIDLYDRDEFVGCMIDITAEKAAAQSLADAQALKTAIVDAAQDAIVAIDAHGFVMDFNAKAETMFGYAREATQGRLLGELIIPDRHRAAHAAGLRRLRDTGASQMLNERVRLDAMRADGSEFPIELTVVQTRIHGQAIYVADIRDLSESAAAEAEKQRLLQLLDDAVESLPNGFTLWSSDDRLVLANSAFGRFYGLDPLALRGMHSTDIFRLILPHIRAINGTRIEDVDEAATFYSEELKSLQGRSMEFELKSGDWRLVTTYPTSDGGQVGVSADITAIKKKEHVLEESERRFRTLIEAHPLPVWLVELESGQILYESPTAAKLAGREWKPGAATFVQEHYANPDDRRMFVQRLRERGELHNYKVRFRKVDGSKLWVSASSRILDLQGRDVAITSLFDLTDQHNREAELRRARETLDDAIESLSEGLALYDADDRLVLCNSQYKSFHCGGEDLLVPGAKWSEISRKRAERGMFTEAVGRVDEWMKEEMAQRVTARNLEFPFVGDRWFEYSHRPTRQGGFVSTWRDVTERKEMEHALQEKEFLLRNVLDACPIPVTMYRMKDGTIIYETPEAQALFGPPSGNSTIHAASRWASQREQSEFFKRLRESGIVDGLEAERQKVDGTTFWAAVSTRLIVYQGEDVAVETVFDLTERHAAEAELGRQREMLHQSEKLSALGELLAGVSHELNNPLSVLVGQALMLRETAPDKKITERAERIGKAADRCARIVKTFLAMARQESCHMERIDVNEVIQSSLEVTAYSLRTSGIDVTLKLAKNLPEVMANVDQIRQVLTNLIINAQGALQEKNEQRRLRITTSYRQKSGQVVIKVKDNGPGIPAEFRSRVFEPLFTTNKVGGGTGMGLALCHRIIEAHDGTIILERAGREGAAFAIRIPRAKRRTKTEVRPRKEESRSAGYRLLVVDDEGDVAQVISDVLEHEGHYVETVSSGTTALEKLKHQRYDVILSDIRMPGMDGPGLYRQLAATMPEQIDRLAFITGDTLTPKIREFLEASERPYLEKPLLPRDIRDLVDLLMRRKCS